MPYGLSCKRQMTIRPLGTETQPGFGETIQLLKVELGIRMNPGTTASLWLPPDPESNAAFGKNFRLELKFSNQVLHLMKTL